MKLLFFSVLGFLFLTVTEPLYIKYIQFDKHSITINYTDSSVVKCPIINEKGKKHFLLNGKTIYIDVDLEAKWNLDIDSLLRVSTLRPDHNSPYLPIMFFVFIIDEDGKIINQGIERKAPQDDYQKEFERLVKSINCKLTPAVVNGKNVASFLKIQTDYYQLLDK